MRPEIALAKNLFDQLQIGTTDSPGVTRASFGEGEAFAHALVAETAKSMELEISHDVAGNQYMTWPGTDRSVPPVITGSHLDSVNHGGNYDGAAGVVMGLAAIHALQQQGFRPQRDITVMAIRAEEMMWFPTHYCGSRMAFGLLDPSDYDAVRRSDTGRSLAEHMRQAGFDPDALKTGAQPLDPTSIHAFIEAHIEQGPILQERGFPVGIVSGIRGNLRYKHCRIDGRYDHAGAVPREYRHDAVFAGTEFVQVLERHWNDCQAAGDDFVATVGEFHTDPSIHAITKVPGQVRFTMDIRSLDDALLLQTDTLLRHEAARISAQRDVSIDLGAFTHAQPAPMHSELCRMLEDIAQSESIPALTMASGAGHDCATFTWQGVPTAMLFVRNQNGSHNPDEAMEIDDFALGTRLLVGLLKRTAQKVA
jgi:N-carbamoyl-L-amino-acid hydrolase